MANKGSGVSVAFDTNFLANITSLNWNDQERPAVKTTTLGTSGAQTYEPADIFEPGTIVCESLFDPADESSLQALSAAETVTVTWTDALAKTWAASGFMTGYSVQAADEIDRVRCTITIKLSGDITISV